MQLKTLPSIDYEEIALRIKKEDKKYQKTTIGDY
jgi:hypothetical protein